MTDAGTQPPPRRQPTRRKGGAAVPILAAVVAAAAVLIVGGIVRSSLDDSETETDPVDAVIADTESIALWFDGDVDGLSLIVADNGDAVLLGDDVAEVADRGTYALWRVDDDTSTLLTTFAPDLVGTVEVLIDDTEIDAGATYEVTLEPTSPSADSGPSGPVVGRAPAGSPPSDDSALPAGSEG